VLFKQASVADESNTLLRKLNIYTMVCVLMMFVVLVEWATVANPGVIMLKVLQRKVDP